MKKALYDLANQINSLKAYIKKFTKQVKAKNTGIIELQKKVRIFEESSDNLEQYTRRPNLRVPGIGKGEDTNATVLVVSNDKICVTPPLHGLERSHRLDGKRTSSRPIIVRFRTERNRDNVYCSRFTLKKHNT